MMRAIPAAFAALMLVQAGAGVARNASDCKPAVEARIAQEQKDRTALAAIMADFKANGLNGLAAAFDDLQDMVDRTPHGEIPDCDGVHYVRVATPTPGAQGDAADPGRVANLPPSPYPLAAASLGAGYTALSQWTDAERVLARGLALDPQNPTLVSGEAFVLSRLGNSAKGLELCDQYLSLSQPPLDRARVLRTRGFLLGELGRYEEGLAAYRESLSLQPGDAQAQNGIAYLTKRKAGAGRADAPPAPVPEIQVRPPQ
jgi:tetratricopeptide (TPR) repeat protein